jgi:hypothetical protein
MKHSEVILTVPPNHTALDHRSSRAPNRIILWASYTLQYSSMVAASFFLWKESFIGFLAFFTGAYLPGIIVQKLDRPTQRFNDECQASAPQWADGLFKAAALMFIVVFILRGALGSYIFQGLLGAYALFVLACAFRDIYLARYCICHWHERHH